MAGGGFVDSYYYFLKYTMKEGLLYGFYMFLVEMGILTSGDADDKVQFISNWLWESWADDTGYYKVSKNIWTFLFEDVNGVCDLSTSTLCKSLKYYWMFIMTLNVFLTLPLSHTAAVYDWAMGNWEKAETVIGWFA